MIKVQGLSKTYSLHVKKPGFVGSLSSLFFRKKIHKTAVREASFEVREGEILGLVGSNGAGKTTLVKMLSGVVYPSSGHAEILGYRPWERKNALRQQISLIMGQKAQLWWDLPAADGLLLLKDIYQIEKKTFEKRVDELTDLLKIRNELEVPIRRLSLGERMKMELVAALVHQPRVVFLDEPTIGLDLQAQKSIREFILNYRSLHKPAMILTSHYMDDIESLCKRLLLMKNGEIVYDGSLKSLMNTQMPYKLLQITLRDSSDASFIEEKINSYQGVIRQQQDQYLILEIPRDQVSAFAKEALTKMTLEDLSIEEPEVSTLISSLFQDSIEHD
jgi:ABC-2 type transport system ATP-binding protein